MSIDRVFYTLTKGFKINKEMWRNINGMNKCLIKCSRCPRLAQFRQKVATTKRNSYKNQEYWGKPVPGFGDINGELLVIGLAPGAHGSNRTGRMFTGDHSGKFLYSVLYEAGFSDKPNSESRYDGLRLKNCYITAAIRCVPPENKPTKEELENCSYFFDAEIGFLKNVKVVVALGKIAFDASIRHLRRRNIRIPKPKFKHGKVLKFDDGKILITSYHPSRQNTQTGKLTKKMFLDIFLVAKKLLKVN
jgi:uracil-DNA glycosylase family 4